MHLSDFMSERGLSDEAVADAVGRNRVSVSRWRRRLVRPDWEAIEAIKAFTDGSVTADDWTGPLVSESSERAEARPCG
jgi:transcriptional regulator with XRE-family HTH domain